MDLSVIIPCYEEHECLPLLFDRITEALGTTGLSYELVFVNDGSRDQTWQLIDEFARSGRAPRVVGVDFSRNYGKEAALLAGLSHATRARSRPCSRAPSTASSRTLRRGRPA